jgi:hypothetical protein
MTEQHSRWVAFSQLLAILEILLFIAAGLSAIFACLVGSHPPGGREAFFTLAALVAGVGAAFHFLRRLLARRRGPSTEAVGLYVFRLSKPKPVGRISDSVIRHYRSADYGFA